MKATLLLILSLIIGFSAFSQTVLYHENFELPSLADSVTSAGTPAWTINSVYFSEGTRSYTNVVPSSGSSYIVTSSFNATNSSNVILQFSHICKIEFGDSAFVEISINGGTSWIQLTGSQYQGSGLFGSWGNRFSSASYASDWDASNSNTTPTNSWWKTEIFDISSIAANQSAVKVRFRLADGSAGLPGAGGAFGWIIDNIKLNGAISELNPPVVTYNTPILQDTIYGTGPFTISATCTDASGIAQAKLVYWLNSGNHDTINMTRTGNIYSANIPSMSYNNKAYYYVYAIDSSLSANTTQTSTIWFYNKKGPSVYIVGTGTGVNSSSGYPAPYTNYYGGAKHQMLIKASELLALGATAGSLTSVGFYVSSLGTSFSGSLSNFRIDIGTTTSTVLTTSSFVGGLTNVFPASTVPIVVGLNTHTFTTPFIWDGTSNIIIQTSYSNVNSGTTTDAVIMFNSDPGFVSTNYYRADGTSAAAILSYATPSGAGNARPNMKISMASNSYANEAGIFQIIEPTSTIYTTSSIPIKVSVKNFGTDTLKKVTIGWTVDGVAQTNAIWTGSLLQDVSSTAFTIGNYSFTTGAHAIKIWTKLPNDSNDLYNLNDTITKSIYVCNGLMAGTYTVGGSGSNYTSLSTALNQLVTCGVNGPVTLLMNGGTYSGSYEIIGNIPGSSSTNSITIKPASGQSVLFTDSTATGMATFKFTKTKYIILDGSNTSNGTSRDMTFENRSTAANTAAIWLSSNGIANGNEDITIKNCIIKAGTNTVSSTFGVYIGGVAISSSGSGEDNDRINLINNNIKRTYYGIYARGTTSGSLNNLAIKSNELGSSTSGDYIQYRGIELAEAINAQISKNKIYNIQTTSSLNISAVEISSGVVNSEFTKNIIYGLRSTSTSGYGAYGINVSGSTVSDILIANNFIYDFITANYSSSSTTYNPFGIRLTAGSNIKVYNNSIYFYGSPSSGSSASMSACMLITSTLTGIEIKNNIFENTMTGISGSKHYSMYTISGVSFTSLDYNNYYAAGTYDYVGYYGSDKQTFANWKLATNKDTNSVNINPGFLSLTDLHTISVNMNNLGIPVGGVITDIDEENRSTTTPDMGADEYTPPMNDATVVSIDPNFNSCVGSNPLFIKIRNNGLNVLQSVKIDWTINGVAQTQMSYNTNLATNTDSLVSLGNINLSANTAYTFKFWVTLPNNSPDEYTSNDTLLISNIYAKLSGNYTIGGSGSDFINFTTAASYLNTIGICGPVVFTVADGVYNESVTISKVPGSGAINNILFRPANGANVTLSSTSNFTLKLNGAINITIDGSNNGTNSRNFSIINTSTSTNTAAIWMASLGTGLDCRYNTIKNCNIESGINSANSSFGIFIAGTSISNSGSANGNDNITIQNNKIQKAWYGIYARGTTTDYIDTLQILENVIGSSDQNKLITTEGIEIQATKASKISGNEIFNLSIGTNNHLVGIQLLDYNKKTQVNNNKIHDFKQNSTTAGYASIGINISASNNDSIFVYNNMVWKLTNYASTSTYYNCGIRVNGGTNHKIYFNSVNLSGAYLSATAVSFSAAYVNGSPTGIDVRNNIFANSMTGATGSKAYAIYCSGSTNPFGQIGFNNYDANGTQSVLGYFGGSDKSNLSIWKTSITNDTASLAVSSGYYSTDNLHSYSNLLDQAGTPIPWITTDIDGEVRNVSTPDIGSDEYTVINIDAGILSLELPAYSCPGMLNIPIKLKNYGSNILNKAQISWTINGVVQSPFNYVGALLPFTDTLINLGTYTFLPNVNYSLKFWTSAPNDSTDGNFANDSLKINNYYTPLSAGTYTVGTSKDFANPIAAASYISTYGICGPVVFSIDPGTYSGQWILNPVPGASATNNIVFQSANNDSTSVVLTYTPTSTTYNFTYTVYMNGIDYLTLKNLTMATGVASGGTGRVIGITSGANYNTIKNCRLLMPVSTSGSIAGIIKNQSSTDNFNTVENNYIHGGQNGINYVGLSTTAPDSGTIFKNNTIVDFSNNGITISNQDSLTIKNNLITSYNGSATPTGLNLTACNNFLRVEKNKIHLNGTGSLVNIILTNCNGNSASRAFIANNFVSSDGTNGTGISINTSSYQNIVYNSTNTNLTSQTSYAFYINGGTNNNILNNCIVHPNAGYAYYVNTTTSVNNSNYNNIYSPNGNYAFWGANRATLTALSTANNKDTNSVSSNPYYVSLNDLHTFDVDLNAKASPIPEIIYDIESDLRNANTPDIGADEFVPLNKDLQITAMINPVSGCALNNAPVTVKVKNVGLDSIGGSFSISYQISSSSPVITESFTSGFTSGQELNFTLTQTANLWAVKDSIFKIKTYITHPFDLNHANDTIINSVLSKYTPKLSITNDTVAWNTSKLLTINSQDSMHWFNTPTGGSIIGYGNTFQTPVLTASKIYYIEAFDVMTNPVVATIGTGTTVNTSTGYPAPYSNYFGGTKHQMLILASELQALGVSAGPITSISFNVSSLGSTFSGSLNNFQIDMGQTSNTALNSSSFITGLTNVFPAATVAISSGINTHNFTTPFVWNGTSNLVIQTSYSNANTGSSTDAVIMYNTATSFVSSNYYYADATSAASILSASSPSSSASARPNIKLNSTGIVQGCTSQRYPLNVVVTGIPTKDIATDSIILPTSSCNIGTQNIKTRLYNAGLDTIKGGITVKYMINKLSGTLVTENCTDTIVPGQKKIYTFTTPVSFIAPVQDSTFNIAVFASVASDNNQTNDTTKGSAIVKYTPAPPVIANQTIPYASSTTLSLVTNDSLLWYMNSTDSIHFFAGSSFNTPILYDTTTYYVSALAKSGGSGLFQVGTGTVTNGSQAYPTPYGNYWYGSKDQYLFTAAELNALGITAGNISSIAWDVSAVNSVPALTDFTIKIDTTSQTALSTWNTLNHTVYTNTAYQAVVGWNTHNFTTPFYWNGISNIVVEACFNNAAYATNGCASVNQTTTSFVSSINYHADASGVCASNSTPSTYTQRPNVKFNASNVVVGCGSSKSPVTVTVTNIPRNDASVKQIITPQGNLAMGTSQPTIIKITNYGYDTLKKVTINWSSNNVLQTPYIWTGSLPSGTTSQNITIGNITFSAGNYVLKVWTKLPNDSVDNYPINDTATSNINACITGGTFTIGGTTADFPNIPAALTYLNGCSLISPVVFNLNPGTYNGQITLGTINGASASNTVTFQAANGDSTSVIINYAATGTVDNWVVRLNQTKYVNFNKVTIQATGATYGYAIYLNGGVQYNKFTNCVIKTLTSTSSNFIGIYSTSSSPDKFNTFTNNKILNGYYGIYWYGSSSARKYGNIFERNIIQDFYYYGIYDYYNDSNLYIGNQFLNSNPSTTNYCLYINYPNGNTIIKKNKIDITSGSSLYGIYLYSTGTSSIISENQINQNTSSTNYGIYIYSATGTSPIHTKVFNNMINLQGSGTGTTYGIYSSSNAYIDINYNTVSIQNGGTSGYALYSISDSYLKLKNNILVNLVGGYAIYVSTASALTASDYNDLFTTGTNLGYYNSARTSLSAWKTATSMDANSISFAPVFISSNNLHTYSVDLNGKGNPIADITTDIDGDVRNLSTPDIGADEFNPPAIDAGITSLNSPSSPVLGGNNSIIITLKNFGLDTLISDSLSWSVNTILQPTYYWTGSLATSASAPITIGSYNFINGNYTIKVWSNHPNNAMDMVNSNDTIIINLTACASPLSGIYTIGGTSADYQSITTAVNSLKYCGISGPVIFKINPGIYNEQIYVGVVNGASANNTITFTSAQGVNTSVVVQFNANSVQNYVWKFDTASYVRIRNISLKATNITFGRVIEFAGTTKFCVIDSCIIEAPVSTASTTAGIYSGTSKDESNQITNNLIKNGYYGIYLQGNNTTNLEIGNYIKNNSITNFYYYGMYLYYQDYLKVLKNFVSNSSSSTTAYGIYTGYCDNGLEINQNKVILNPSTSAYGMYIYYCDGSASTNGLISNNFISITSATSTAYGLYPYYSTYQNIVFNNINVATASTSRSLYSYYGSNLIYNNNCIVNSVAGGYAFYSATTNTFTSNFNNLYVSQATTAYIGYYSSAKTSLTDWQTATGGDANSVSTDPGYYSNTDLHVSSVGLNNKAIPINGILVDIDGNSRNSTTPDIGADEFTPQNKDAAVFALAQPSTIYSPVGTSVTIEITLKNLGMDTLDSIPVAFKYGSNPVVQGMWVGILAPNSQSNYTFTQTFTSIAGSQLIKIYCNVVADQNLNNDTLTFTYTGIPVLTLAYADSFDTGINNWVAVGPQNLWQKGTPSKNIINSAFSAPNAWVTDLMNQYPANATNECLYSPFFNFSSITGATLKFRHWYETQANNDGGRIQFSTDGVTWSNLGYMSDPNGTNWVNSNVGGVHQWTGSSSGWIVSTYNLAQFDNSPLPVQFRFNFNSNGSVSNDGWAIDNFEITIPQVAIDAKMDAIIFPATSTVIGSTVQVKVRIKNIGSSVLTTVPMNYSINSGNQVAGQWSGNLASGDTISYVFPTTFTCPSNTYNLCATLIVPGDMYSQNDFECKNINVIAPPLDAGITHILHPDDTTTDPTVNHVVVVRIKNFGTSALSNIPVQYQVGTNTPVIEQWSGNLLPDSSADYTFIATYKPTTIGWYALCAKTNLTGDGWINNDATCKNKYSGTSIEDNWKLAFNLSQNAPNPASNSTEIRFEIPVSSQVNFKITNMLGQVIFLQNSLFASGENKIEVNTSGFSQGVYYYSIEVDGHRLTKKMIIEK